MPEEYNIYCDERCHLEHDRPQWMVLRAICCPEEKIPLSSERMKGIKIENNLPRQFEIKWTRASRGKLQFYLDLLKFFLDYQDHLFRALTVPDKSILNHKAQKQTPM